MIRKKWVITISCLGLLSNLLLAQPVQASAASDSLTACIAAINDPLYTRATLPGLMTYTSSFNGTVTTYNSATDIENAITNGTLKIWIASAAGSFGTADGSVSDLYCGDFHDNTGMVLDAAAGKRDYFFGGAGNDSVTNMWESAFYGGPGDDSVSNMSEASLFEGGPGNDTYTTKSTDSTFNQGVDIDMTPPSFNSFALPGNVKLATKNGAILITANVTLAGTVTFYAAGRRIPKCVNIPTTGSSPNIVATCSWKPLTHGQVSLSAITLATSNNVSSSTTVPLQVTVRPRSSAR